MSTTSVPRLVGATWYPVPCPEGVPLTLGFPSEEACASFCEGVEPILAAHQDEIESVTEKAFDDGHEAGHESGYSDGYDEAWLEAEERCLAGKCVARSAESA